MPAATYSTIVPSPPDAVFAFIANGENARSWRPGVLDIKLVSGSGVGAAYAQGVRGPGGRRIAADYEVTAFEPPHRLAFRRDGGSGAAGRRVPARGRPRGHARDVLAVRRARRDQGPPDGTLRSEDDGRGGPHARPDRRGDGRGLSSLGRRRVRPTHIPARGAPFAPICESRRTIQPLGTQSVVSVRCRNESDSRRAARRQECASCARPAGEVPGGPTLGAERDALPQPTGARCSTTIGSMSSAGVNPKTWPRNDSSRGRHPPARLGLAVAVALALERDRRVRDAAPVERRDHRVELRRRHDLVVEALRDQHRRDDPVERVDRRPVAEHLPALRPRREERLVVARLELVAVEVDQLEVGDAEVRDARGEHLGPRRRAARVVKPPALPPRIASRRGSTAPRSTRNRAAATQSSTSTIPHSPLSASRYGRP